MDRRIFHLTGTLRQALPLLRDISDAKYVALEILYQRLGGYTVSTSTSAMSLLQYWWLLPRVLFVTIST
jgi:hypothetical protein